LEYASGAVSTIVVALVFASLPRTSFAGEISLFPYCYSIPFFSH
jgi:hypothetical protein